MPFRARFHVRHLALYFFSSVAACGEPTSDGEANASGGATTGGASGSGGASAGSRPGGSAGTIAGAGAGFVNGGGGAGREDGQAGSVSGGTGANSGAGGSVGGATAGGEAGAAGLGGVASGGGGSGAGQEGTGSAGSDGKAGSGGGGGPVTVYLAGDSTVSTYADTASSNDQAGWGQMFDALFDTRVTVQNRASGGQTARRFIDENKLAPILSALRAGDYFLVQFGTNDGNRNATYTLNGQAIPYYLDPATDFKTYLQQYIDGARARGATPVLVTPPPRNSAYCTGGNGTGAHATAMRELGMTENVAVSDLNAKTVAHLRAICPSPTPENFFLVRSDGTVDGTHFQENGARVLAGFVADGLGEAGVPLSQYRL